MFVALEVAKRPDKTWGDRLKLRFAKQQTRMDFQECCGARYAVLHVLEGRHGIDWEELEWLSSEHSRMVLLPEGLELPEGSRLQAFAPEKFDEQVLLHTACDLIARTRMPMYRRVLGLLDRDGSYRYMLPKLLRHYTSVRVLTENLPAYHKAAEDMMEQLGAPVMVSGELTAFSDCTIAISPDGYYPFGDMPLGCTVLWGKTPERMPAVSSIHSLQAGLPEFARPPEGIPAHLFAGALYEIGGVDRISFEAKRLVFDHRFCSARDAAMLLCQKIFPGNEYKLIKR